MPEIRLVAITEAGSAAEALELPPAARQVLPATAAMYRATGFVPPWIGYLAVSEGRVVGTCAFKSAPVDGRVEIAYFTFPEFEGRGIATAMARRLVALARAERPGITVTAQTLPARNASNSILEKLGFRLSGTATDAEAGEVWEWRLAERRSAALIGTFLFFWIAPATVGGWIPWYFTRWSSGTPLFDGAASRWLGAACILAGAAIVIECFARFALKGLGTPAPVAPTKHLVVSGLYRHLRNPMYVGVVTAILGQALWFGSTTLLGYAAAVFAGVFLFVLLYEEPTLRRQFGAEYEDYCRGVPRWLPRIRPWRGA